MTDGRVHRRGDPAGDSYRVRTGDIDASTLALVEELCQRFQLGVGLANVKLNFQDGRFEHAWLERRVQKAKLLRSTSRAGRRAENARLARALARSGSRILSIPHAKRRRTFVVVGLENRYPSLGGSRVQIPPPPLAQGRSAPCGELAPRREWTLREAARRPPHPQQELPYRFGIRTTLISAASPGNGCSL
jgi:hypothetical protein